MKKIDWITLAEAVGLSAALIAAIFGIVWLANNFAWGLLGLATAGSSFFAYYYLKEYKSNKRPEVDIREEAYFQGFSDGKKAAEEDYLEGLIKPKEK